MGAARDMGHSKEVGLPRKIRLSARRGLSDSGPPAKVYVAATIAATVVLLLLGSVSTAAWTSTTSNSGNSFAADSLGAPSNLSATGRCGLIIVGPEVALSWTATPSTYATGYLILRSDTSGGPYTQVGSVSGRDTTTFTDQNVSGGRTYYYVVQATYAGWTSANSNEASATTPGLCL